jgi:antitoxin component of MazEF toxin-antitoxin module
VLHRIYSVYPHILMPLIKKLSNHGNSLALILDRSVLELLNISPETSLDVRTDNGRRLIITPVEGSPEVAPVARKTKSD